MIHDLTMEQYRALPALNAGGIWTLSEVCPARFWAESPFNPAALPAKHQKEFDIGTAVHLAVLEPDLYSERICHIPFNDYRTLEARQLRDGAYIAGQTPLKPAEVEIVDGVRDALMARTEIYKLFSGGRAEVSLTWEIDGLPCKCRPDYMAEDYLLDLKTVASAHPRAAGMAAIRDGWHVRVPWYLEGIAQNGGTPRRLHYLFVCIEKQPPYLLEVYELEVRAIAWGEQIIRRGLRLFKHCRELGRWPGYNDHWPVPLALPSFAEYQLADREQAGEFSECASIAIRRGNEFLRP